MGRSHKKGQGRGGANPKNGRRGPIEWTPKMTMHVLDLSRDDDFLNHLLVEKLGTGVVPLYVHKMDPKRPLPKTDPKDLIAIVHRLIVAKGPFQKAIKQAVDELLQLHGVVTFVKKFSQPQIDAFATHASRYFELYSPDGCVEIAHTSRYTHKTGKSELCILATRNLLPGALITELKGSMAKLTREDERAMKTNGTIRMDFSVIHSGQMKKNHLFLGPARFVNHDCDNNCEIYREGKYITFKVIKKIERGEEITAHYGDGYFGRRNRHCLCATCEKHGVGGYADPVPDDELSESSSDSSLDSDTSLSESEEDVKPAIPLNVNERRTRRGVYHTQDTVVNSDEEDKRKEQSTETDKEPEKIVSDWKIPKIEESEQVIDLCSDVSLLSSSNTSISQAGPSRDAGLMTPDTETETSSSVQVTPTVTTHDSDGFPSKSTPSTPHKSVISTHCQKSAASVASLSVTSTPRISRKVKIEAIEQNHLVTPPPSVEGASPSNGSITPVFEKRVTRSVSSAQKSVGKSRGIASASSTKGKGRASEVISVDDDEEERKPGVTRVLRARPSVFKLIESPVKAEIPRDERGRPLPTCNTCNDILPIIHVDQEVVWGNGKKKEMTECPRCMRHFAIYNYPWPARTVSQRVLFMPTPREELTPVESSSRKVSARVLPALDKKLAAAIKSPQKSRRREFAVEEPPAKKQKTDRGTKDMVSGSGRTTSGRHSLPSTKVREHSEKRPVGRPRLTTPPPRSTTTTKTTVKIEPVSAPADSRKFFNRPPPPRPKSNKSIVAAGQPRDGSGRFGIKETTGGKYQRKNIRTPDSRAQRALEREKIRAQLEARTAESGDESDDESDKDEVGNPLRSIGERERKRRNEVGIELRESPRKKTRVGQEGDAWGNQPTPPRAHVYGKPNPFVFARNRWAPKPQPAPEGWSGSGIQILDGSLKSVKHTVKFESETGRDWRTHLITSTAQEEVQEGLSPVAALTLKPTPFTYAKRRWSSDLWRAKSSRMLSHGGEQSDEENSDAGDSDAEEEESTNVNIDFSKRYAAFYVRAQQDMKWLDDSSSGEEDIFGAERPNYALQRRASFSNRGVPNANNSVKP